jgi:hypothetical protein
MAQIKSRGDVMDANAIAVTASCAAATGIGAGLAIRLAPAFVAAHRNWSSLRNVPDATANDEMNPLAHTRIPGRVRNSSIAGIYRDALRHTDGAFTRAYHVELSPTVFSGDLVIENRCDAFARMLAARKPVGTIIQFRLTADVDRGLAIAKHDEARNPGGIHGDAAILHEGGIGKYQTMADLGCFRQTRLTVWVRVPNPHRRVEDQFLPTLKREIQRCGLIGLPSAFRIKN